MCRRVFSEGLSADVLVSRIDVESDLDHAHSKGRFLTGHRRISQDVEGFIPKGQAVALKSDPYAQEGQVSTGNEGGFGSRGD
jgi:hypothetical protein